MSTKAETERAEFLFRVAEGSDRGMPVWISLEMGKGSLSVLEDGFLGLDLQPGTTFERAQEIAKFLSENIKGVSHTRFL